MDLRKTLEDVTTHLMVLMDLHVLDDKPEGYWAGWVDALQWVKKLLEQKIGSEDERHIWSD